MIRWVPHAAASAETAIVADVRKKTLTGRLMRAGIIRNNGLAMARTPLTAGLALVLATALAACGRTQVVGPDRTLHLALSEYRLNPEKVQAQAGQLKIFVVNDGRLTHNLAVSRNGRVAGSTPPITPGGHTELTVTLTRGSYLIDSTMLSDQALGLYGTLVVK